MKKEYTHINFDEAGEYFTKTYNLRWNGEALEQMERGSLGTEIWKPVKQVKDK